MVTAAAVAAGMVFHVLRRGYAAQFERFGDVLLDGMLDFVKFLAGIEKTARDGIVQQRVAVFFKIGDFGVVQLRSLRLFFVKRLALAHHGLILATGTRVGHKSADPLADGSHAGLVHDGLTQRPGFFQNRNFFNLSRHRSESITTASISQAKSEGK
jgi:hypothetical protein